MMTVRQHGNERIPRGERALDDLLTLRDEDSARAGLLELRFGEPRVGRKLRNIQIQYLNDLHSFISRAGGYHSGFRYRIR